MKKNISKIVITFLFMLSIVACSKNLEILKDQAILEAYYGKKLVVHCHSGRRAGLVTDVLGKNSFASVHQLEGDFAAWKSSNLPLVR